MLTEREFQILLAIVRYYVLSRPQIQRLFFQGDRGGRHTRRRLQMLVDEHLIDRQRMLYCLPTAGSPSSVYYPSPKGCQLLAEHFEDDRFLLTPVQAPIPHHINHWLAISETHITLDQAIKNETELTVADWVNEWDIVNKDESVPENRFRLFTLLNDQPRLVNSPDAAFVLSMLGHRKVYFLEQDRATSGVNQIASSKTQGYSIMAERQLHREQFPQVNVSSFTILMIAPTAQRRDALRRAIHGKPGSALWRFAAANELTPETFLRAPLFYPCEGDPSSLIKVPADVRNAAQNTSGIGHGGTS